MKKALIVYGGWEGHDPKGLAFLFKSVLEKEQIEVVLSESLSILKNDLSVYDLIIPIWTMGEIGSEEEQNILEAVAKGTGLAGCHGGMCDAFRNNTDWQFMTGSQWVAHPGNTIEYQVNIKRSSDSFITEGIEDFTVFSEQYYIHYDPAINILATTDFVLKDNAQSANGKVTLPVVYTKKWGKGKVFYNSLGHSAKLFTDVPQALEIMRRGFLWAIR